MALNNLIPQIWAKELDLNLRKNLVYANDAVINHDYEGEITDLGDTVKIGAIGAITVNTYTKNSDMNTPDTLTDAQTTLLIDQAKYFNFQVDDVDQRQQQPKIMAAAMEEASYAVKDTIDQFIGGLVSQMGVPATGTNGTNYRGTDGTPTTITTNAYSELTELSVLMDNAKVPSDGRFVVVPPWFIAKLLQDNNFIGYGTAINATLRDQGSPIGMPMQVAGFTVYKSQNNSFKSGGDINTGVRCIAGVRTGWTYAGQITKMESFRLERRFADGVKGLYVYGGKVVRPSKFVVGTFTKG